MLDADDTTLWTYDMEDAGMNFDFDPALQDVYVQDQRFPATPGMVDFVTRPPSLGFTVFGLTGRNDDQKTATVANLTKVGYRRSPPTTFFTKWVAGTPSRTHPDLVRHVRGRQLHDGRVQGRHPRSTSRSWATTSCSTSVTSGPTCRAGTPTRC